MFLSCGDALFDLFATPDDDAATVSLNGRVGGSPLNVALGLSRLGHPAGYLAKISSDMFGERIRAFMANEAIGDGLLVPTDRNTTLAMVSTGPDGSPAYNFYIDGTADRSLRADELPAELPAEVEAIHFASYSMVVEPTASALEALAGREHESRFISYDPNIRAAIEPDLERWRQRIETMLPFTNLIKASTEDLALIYPDRSPESVVEAWAAAGPGLAVLTRGENGASARTATGLAVERPGLTVETADTVGAGDTFQAALLAGLKENDHLSDEALNDIGEAELSALLDAAIRAAAVTCSRGGADLPTRSDLGRAPLA